MILGHESLLKRIGEGLLVDYDKSLIGGAGYDLRIGNLYSLDGQAMLCKDMRKLADITLIDAERYDLKPSEYVLLETVESVNMPKDLAARVLNRSTLFRSGCRLSTALVDPGYRGRLTFGLENMSKNKFTIERGAAAAQIVFEQVSGRTKAYDGRYQGGKVV